VNSQAIGRYIITVIAGLLVWLVIYLIKRKLNNPDFGTEWGGIGVSAFFALLFVIFSVTAWFGLYIESKSIDIDADFVGVIPDTVTLDQTGGKIYKWKLECRWNDPISGRQITFKSEPFEGTDLYYNRSKIKVSVYPDKPETFYTVDLSFITTNQTSGIKLITEKLLAAADQDAATKQERKKAYDKDQEIRREKGRGLTVLFNRLMFAGTVLLIVVGLIIGGWLYFRHRATQNRILEFTASTTQLMQSRGWSFSFQPYDRPWEGVAGMLRKEPEVIYPEGFVEIKGKTQNTAWTLAVSINRPSRRGYYRSTQDYWLRNSSCTRLTIPTQAYQDDAFLAFMEVPKFFPDNIRSTLAQSYNAVDHKFLGDFTSADDQELIHTYVYRLFDKFNHALYEPAVTHRSGEHYADTFFLTITNIPNQADQTINQKVRADLIKIGKSEKGGYGILLSRDGIVVSTLHPLLKPDDIQAMIDLGMMLRTEINKSQ